MPREQIEIDLHEAQSERARLEESDARADAQKTLGPKFDIKQFHEVLREGAMPLSILQRRIKERTAAIA